MPLYRVRTLLTGSPVGDGVSTVHYDASAGSPGQAVSAQGFLLATWSPFVNQFQNWVVSGTVDLIDETNGELIDSTSGDDFPVDTTGTEAPLSPMTMMLVRLTTGVVVGGRRLKGRMFLPGFTELANVAGGIVDPSLISGSASNLEDWTTGADATPVVWHRPKDATAGSFSPVISGTIWSQWAVLRQRRPQS